MSESILDFLQPLNLSEISMDAGYKDGQVGKVIKTYEDEFPDLDEVDIVLVGCGEQRGSALLHTSGAANAIRDEFYSLYYWHQDVRLADVGDIRIGKSVNDTYAALK